MRLFTIGFTQKRAEEFFGLLREHGVERLVDIRINPGGQLSGFAKQEDLPYFLSRLADGCQYVHIPMLAPTKELLRQFRADADWSGYDPNHVCFLRELDTPERRDVLCRTLFPSVGKIFDAPIRSDMGHYVLRGEGVRSLGTIRPRQVTKVIHEMSPEGQSKYRLHFADGERTAYRLTVTDLTWRYYIDSQRGRGNSPRRVCEEITHLLRDRDVFLRIGLTRGWVEFPDRCFLQVTAVHTLPDYLGGNTFAYYANSRKTP
jgi:hypothetical protein